MTLNITALTPYYIVQVSDRRMVYLDATGVPRDPPDDRGNKAIVVECDDGVFAITFCGIGEAGGQRTDLWLANWLMKEGGPDLPVTAMVEVICREATAWFGGFAASLPQHLRDHDFIVAGWRRDRPTPVPSMWIISVDNLQGRSTPRFGVVRHNQPAAGRWEVTVTGLHQALHRNEKRRIMAAIKKAPTVDRMENVLVEAVKSAVHQFVGQGSSVIALAPDGAVRATLHPAEGLPHDNMPVFIWHEAGLNITVGHAAISGGVEWCTVGGGRFHLKLAGKEPMPVGEGQARVGALNKMVPSKHKPGITDGSQVILMEFDPFRR